MVWQLHEPARTTVCVSPCAFLLDTKPFSVCVCVAWFQVELDVQSNLEGTHTVLASWACLSCSLLRSHQFDRVRTWLPNIIKIDFLRLPSWRTTSSNATEKELIPVFSSANNTRADVCVYSWTAVRLIDFCVTELCLTISPLNARKTKKVNLRTI